MKITDYFKPKPHRPVDALVQKLLKEPPQTKRKRSSKPPFVDEVFQKRKSKKKLSV